MQTLSQHIHSDHVHPAFGVEQVGWIGQTGAVYALDDPPYDSREPAGFSPLYQPRDEECGHAADERARIVAGLRAIPWHGATANAHTHADMIERGEI